MKILRGDMFTEEFISIIRERFTNMIMIVLREFGGGMMMVYIPKAN
jgi:hypothetical protein